MVIYVLTGSNSFTKTQRKNELIKRLKKEVYKPDIDNLKLSELPTFLLGESLFFEPTILILNNLSQRSDIFPQAVDLMISNKDKADVILIEDSLDKRTTTYKKIAKNLKVEDFKSFTERDARQLENWLKNYIKSNKISADTESISYLVKWVGSDQTKLASAADRLILMNSFTKNGIEQYIPRTPTSISFDLLSAAINGNQKEVRKITQDLKQTQDPYRLFGLLASQLIQALAVSYASTYDSVGKDLSVNSYALNNIKRSISLSRTQAVYAVDILYDADKAIKTSTTEPWQAVDVALSKLSQIKK